MTSNTTSIALCTYNGARYLDAQLASLACQTRLPDELVVCDDRSTDDTVLLLQRFAESAPFAVRITVNERRLGPAANFAQAAALCGGDAVFFCDQDDVWRENKIDVLLSALEKSEIEYGKETPILVHSDLEVVDDDLRPTYPSFFGLMGFETEPQQITDLLNRNVVTGCSAVVNRPLIALALPMPAAALMHDWWFALCARTQGAVVTVNDTLVQYRQHGANQIGASPFASRLARACRNPLRQWQDSMLSFRENIAQAQVLAECLAERCGQRQDAATAVAAYASITRISRWNRLKTVIEWRLGRRSMAGVAWFMLKSLFA